MTFLFVLIVCISSTLNIRNEFQIRSLSVWQKRKVHWKQEGKKKIYSRLNFLTCFCKIIKNNLLITEFSFFLTKVWQKKRNITSDSNTPGEINPERCFSSPASFNVDKSVGTMHKGLFFDSKSSPYNNGLGRFFNSMSLLVAIVSTANYGWCWWEQCGHDDWELGREFLVVWVLQLWAINASSVWSKVEMP